MNSNINNLKNSFAIGAKAIDARTKFSIDRMKYLPSSEAGNCIRKAWYTRHMPQTAVESGRGYARRGTHGETYMVEALRAANVPLVHAGVDQESLVCNETMMSATPDGAIVDDGNATGVEFKTIDPRTNERYLPRAAHVTQLQISMALMALQYEYDFTESGGLLMYMDASDFDKVHVFGVPFDEGILEEYAPRAQKVLRTRNVERLDREGRTNGRECKTCPFALECLGGEAVPETTGARGNRGSNLSDHVEGYVTAKQARDSAAAALQASREQIIADLKKRNVRTIDVAGHSVELVQRPGRKTIDKKLMASSGIEVEAYQKEGAPYEELRVV